MNRTASYLSMGVAAAVLLSGCASMSGGAPRDIDKPPPGILAEKSDAELAQQNSKGDLPPADLRPVHARGLDLTKTSEGWVPKLYNDAAGYCTIGYGHLIKKARCNGSESPDFKPSITKEHGTRLLVGDMASAQRTVVGAVKVTLDDYQYAALTDFVFNVGSANFRSSTLLKKVNANAFDEVPAQLLRWTKAGGKTYPGLVTRRKAEVALFQYAMSKAEKEKSSKAVPAADEAGEIDIQAGERK